MRELYNYMAVKREEMYESGSASVEIDMAHFFRLYQMICYMLQIKNIVNVDDDAERTIAEIRDAEQAK